MTPGSNQRYNTTIMISVVLACGLLFFAKGPTATIIVAIMGTFCVFFVVYGLYCLNKNPLSPEMKRALRERLAAQGYTKENRADRRRAAKVALAFLIWMFLTIPAVVALDAYLIRSHYSVWLPDALVILAIGALSFLLARVISKAVAALMRPYDKLID